MGLKKIKESFAKTLFAKKWKERGGWGNARNGAAISLYALYAIICIWVPGEFSTNDSAAYVNYGLGLVAALAIAIIYEVYQSTQGETPNEWEVLFTGVGSPIGATIGLLYVVLTGLPVWGLLIIASIIFGYSLYKRK